VAFTIEQHHVIKYADDVQMAYQQDASRMRNCVELKTGIVGKSFSTNDIDIVEAVTKDSRHEQHSHQDPEHKVRWGNLTYYYNSIMMDRDDDARVLADPKNSYVMTNAASLGRRADRTIISALLGTAVTLEDRTGTQALPTAQKVTGSTSALTKAKILTAKRLLDAAEVPDGDRYFAISAQGLEDMLAITEVISSDYNTVKALVDGQINTWLGFKWVRTELLPIGVVTTLVRQAIAWHKSALVFGETTASQYTRIKQRTDMHDAWETYAAIDIGAVRKRDKGVVEVHYLET
jgi:hypothetical protein